MSLKHGKSNKKHQALLAHLLGALEFVQDSAMKFRCKESEN